MKQTFKIIAIAAIATAALVKGVPAFAEPAAPSPVVSVVKTADLDLRSVAGRSTLDHRLVRAAADVCGSASDSNLRGANDARRCRTEVLTEARARTATLIAARSAPTEVLVATR
jgi:UrcA family protein